MATAAVLKTELLSDEDRSSRRHQLWLSARISSRGEADQVLIHNLSTSGLLFESKLDLDLGDKFEIDLPEAGITPAEVVWTSGSYYGCEFASPVVAAAVSASRLRSPLPQPAAPEHIGAPLPTTDPNALSPLQKTAVIVGLASACWVPIIAAVTYL